MSEQDAIVVFTARSPDRIVREGGSQSWVLNAARAKQCGWLVCTQNRNNPDHEFSDATERHGSAFLLGKISGVRRSTEDGDDDRWMISISEYARINVPDAWDHGRNPVRYTSLADLGISLNELEFVLMPQSAPDPSSQATQTARPGIPSLTIAEAKTALAATFGVKPEAVEITIRG